LVIRGDLIRRTMLCRIDARVEQPETRVFDNDPVTLALDWRAELVTDALTILRAYHVAGRPGKPRPLGSFEDWSDLVRGALLWLGDADPVESMNQLRKSDPVLATMRAVMGQWTLAIGSDGVTSAEVIRKATDRHPGIDGQGGFINPDFRDALLAAAGKGETVSSQALGKWLQRHQDRVVDGVRFVKRKERQGVAVWALAVPKEGEFVGMIAAKPGWIVARFSLCVCAHSLPRLPPLPRTTKEASKKAVS
jgi:putative DNA primase/helicase